MKLNEGNSFSSIEKLRKSVGPTTSKKAYSIGSTATESFTSAISESPVGSCGDSNTFSLDYLDDCFSGTTFYNHYDSSLMRKDLEDKTNNISPNNIEKCFFQPSLFVELDSMKSYESEISLNSPLVVNLSKNNICESNNNSLMVGQNIYANLTLPGTRKFFKENCESKLRVDANEFKPRRISVKFNYYCDLNISKSRNSDYKCFCVEREGSVLFQHNINGMVYYKNLNIPSTVIEQDHLEYEGRLKMYLFCIQINVCCPCHQQRGSCG